jgi:hypothetical protein
MDPIRRDGLPMISLNNVKLGRHPANLTKVAAHVQARDVIDLSRLSIPAARDWSMVDGRPLVFPMFANDRLSNCVFASLGHSQIVQSANSGAEVAVTEAEIVDAYQRLGGYVPSDPSTDNGANMLEVGLRCYGGETVAGQTLEAIVAVNPRDNDMLAVASEFFGGLWLGWDLPKAWQDADVWDVSPTGSSSGDWAPRSWGGHATSSQAWSPALRGLKTWTIDKPYTPAAAHLYCEEAYGLVWKELWTRLQGGLCPAGLDLQKLRDLMALVVG